MWQVKEEGTYPFSSDGVVFNSHVKEKVYKKDGIVELTVNVPGHSNKDLSVIYDWNNDVLYIESLNKDKENPVNIQYKLNYIVDDIGAEITDGILYITIETDQFEDVEIK